MEEPTMAHMSLVRVINPFNDNGQLWSISIVNTKQIAHTVN